jgi:peptidoglycan hydrolase CwlO-like protein
MQGGTFRTIRRVLVGTVAVALLLLASWPAAAQDELTRLRQERERVQSERAEAATQVDAQQAEIGQVTAALEALQAQVNAAEVRVADAQRRLADAEVRQARSEQAVVDARTRIGVLEGQLATRAVESFVSRSSAGTPTLFDHDDLLLSVRMQSLVDVVTQSEGDVVEQMASAREDLQVEEAAARQARDEAANHRLQVEDELAALGQARDAQARLADEADQRLDRMLSEVQALAALEGQLGQQIAEAEAEAARRLAEAQAAAARARAARRSGGSAPTLVPAGEIVNVRGIWIHRSIAGQLEGLLAAAEAAGHHYGGGGYRDPNDQIRLRRAHCGSSDEAVFQASPSSCSPPTARPGTSNHERGLAVDFVYEGGVIATRSSPGYQWLAANAAAFGFYNLPSEPWHWSVNGQ